MPAGVFAAPAIGNPKLTPRETGNVPGQVSQGVPGRIAAESMTDVLACGVTPADAHPANPESERESAAIRIPDWYAPAAIPEVSAAQCAVPFRLASGSRF